jgi:hypothetical protein
MATTSEGKNEVPGGKLDHAGRNFTRIRSEIKLIKASGIGNQNAEQVHPKSAVGLDYKNAGTFTI